MPFCNADGIPDPSLLFIGSISQKATKLSCLLRFARFARALPAGGDEIAMVNLREHHDLLSSPGKEIPDGLPRLFSLVSNTVCRKESLKEVGVPGFSLSNSSCLERTRAEGGAAAFLRDMLSDSLEGEMIQTDNDLDDPQMRLYLGYPSDFSTVNVASYLMSVRTAFGDAAFLKAAHGIDPTRIIDPLTLRYL